DGDDEAPISGALEVSQGPWPKVVASMYSGSFFASCAVCDLLSFGWIEQPVDDIVGREPLLVHCEKSHMATAIKDRRLAEVGDIRGLGLAFRAPLSPNKAGYARYARTYARTRDRTGTRLDCIEDNVSEQYDVEVAKLETPRWGSSHTERKR
ncbi:hypothetical protein FOZ63_020261, partial [Perkinsus olseni]